MQRIPDLSQRETYRVYIRDGFQRKRHLVQHSREAIAAIEDAREQVERMDYFHSIREEKELQQQNDKQQEPSVDVSTTNQAKNAAKSSIDKHLLSLDASLSLQEKYQAVKTWLEEALPLLYVDDLATYASQLVDDGFDSTEMLETELRADDLDFMKKAHRRVLIRIKEIQDTNG
jgi:hypothetical protein